ncbi:hypothetical protein SNOUR_33550 [Streptomyces noursei ATCC 11455]|uniref:hypothetical protein n=1 Tax=Streptomyces noursei TaxID=1971 RepID=UPI00081CDF11|nr:hypothetical protein SNOUR_33550 [Streptomyces noursei ATCC 11455]
MKEQFLRELTAVQRLGILSDDNQGGHLAREYLVRRAAALDRLAETDDPGGPLTALHSADTVLDAVHYAHALIEYDSQHRTTRGPIPAHAPCWEENPRGYARQEHAMWLLEHDV